MPAMAATGRYCAKGARKSMMSSKNTAEKIAAKGVCAPACTLRPLRLKEPLEA